MNTYSSNQLTVQVVGWNSADTLAATCRALRAAVSEGITVRYLDNASTDDSVSIVKTLLPQAEIMRLPTNQGFVAHNLGFSKCTTPLVMTCDPDLEIDWNGIKKLLGFFDNARIAALQGKLLRTEGNKLIDSAGIVTTLALNGKERGAGEADTGQFESAATVAAVSGACGIYRKAALDQIAYKDFEIFDNDFFAYKEDVDLGWRLRRAGWEIKYFPVLIGRHRRTLGKRGVIPWYLNPAGLYRRLSSPRTAYSLRNYVWMLIKNISVGQLAVFGLFICLRLAYFFILSLLCPPLFKAWPQILHGWPDMLRKRAAAKRI